MRPPFLPLGPPRTTLTSSRTSRTPLVPLLVVLLLPLLTTGYHHEQLWTTPVEKGAKPSLVGFESQPAPWPLVGQTPNCDAKSTGEDNGECVSTRCPQVCMCTLTVWNCENAGISEVPSGMSQTIINIFLRGNRIRKVNKHAFKDLPNLEVIDMSDNLLDDIHQFSFDNLPGLKRVNLSQNPPLKSIKPLTFTDLPVLHTIYFDRCNITSIVPGCFNKLPYLEVMSFMANKHLELIEPGAFQDLPALRTLNFLHTPIATLHWLTGIQSVSSSRRGRGSQQGGGSGGEGRVHVF